MMLDCTVPKTVKACVNNKIPNQINGDLEFSSYSFKMQRRIEDECKTPSNEEALMELSQKLKSKLDNYEFFDQTR
jgi:hypothetical protein